VGSLLPQSACTQPHLARPLLVCFSGPVVFRLTRCTSSQPPHGFMCSTAASLLRRASALPGRQTFPRGASRTTYPHKTRELLRASYWKCTLAASLCREWPGRFCRKVLDGLHLRVLIRCVVSLSTNRIAILQNADKRPLALSCSKEVKCKGLQHSCVGCRRVSLTGSLSLTAVSHGWIQCEQHSVWLLLISHWY